MLISHELMGMSMLIVIQSVVSVFTGKQVSAYESIFSPPSV